MNPLARTLLAVSLTAGVSATFLAASTQQMPPPPQAPRPGTGLILGRVIDAETNKPLDAALVGYTVAGTTPIVRDRVKTDAHGRFVFFNLIAGTYNFTVAKANYSNYIAGIIRLDLADGQKVGDFTIRLSPTTATQAVIAGMVTDEGGEPIVNARVTLLTAYNAGTGPGFWQAGGARTDDRGIFRALAIRGAGEYLVMVTSTLASAPLSTLETLDELRQTGRSVTELQRELAAADVVIGTEAPARPGTAAAMDIGGVVHTLTNLVKPPRIGSDGRLHGYPTTFYPGTPWPSRATKITLRTGEDRAGVDIRLTPSRMLRVSGTLSNPSGPAANVALRLVTQDRGDLQADLDMATTLSDDAGRFTFAAVPPGDYVVKAARIPRAAAATASTPTVVETGTDTVTMSGGLPTPAPPPATPTEPTLWASTSVTVADADVEGVVVVMRPGARVSGRVEFAGSTPRPSADQLVRVTISASTPDGRSRISGMSGGAPSLSGRVTADGQFTTLGLAPGPWVIGVSNGPPGWTLKSVMVNGRDVAETPIDASDVDITGVSIILSDRLTSLTGRVTLPAMTSQTRQTEAARVIALPADRARWSNYGSLSRRILNVAVAPDGTYTFPDLPHGAYLVLATTTPLPRDWRDPRNLETFARQARPVQLSEGEKKVQDLTVVRAR